MDGNRILHFTLGTRRFGLNVSEITEISEIAAPTQVPGAPDVIAGIVELRGRIVTLMDLATIHGAPQSSDPGRLAVQLAPPLAHLGILVPGRVENLETGSASLDPRPQPDAEEPERPAPDGDESWRGLLGREIVVGGRPTYVLDVEAHFRFCSMRVRERFRVAE